MALKDLVARQSAITEEAIEKIISPYVRYDADERAVALLPPFATLGNRQKVLVYLTALQGWRFVVDSAESVAPDARPAELEAVLGIPGGSLRPILKDLKDGHFIAVTTKGRYGVRAVNFETVRGELPSGDTSVTVDWVGGLSPRRAKRRRANSRLEVEAEEKDAVSSGTVGRRRRASSGGAAAKFSEWLKSSYFDQPRTLADVLSKFHDEAIIIPTTSIPKYLLKAVRDQHLSRSKQSVGGREVWVYKSRRS